MQDDPLAAVQAWYAAQCDGEWEHRYGVVIETLDNPGWSLKVDLVGTPLEGKNAELEAAERTESDWVHIWSDGQTFQGAGGSGNLSELLAAFSYFAKPSEP